MNLTLGADSDARKKIPVFSGCLAYFAAALAGVAKHSFVSNEKHNPGEPLHWSRGKSADHEDCQTRHLMDIADMRAELRRGDKPYDSALVAALLTEANANSWRALALSQELHEEFGGAPLSPGSVAPPVEPCVDTVTVKAFPFKVGQKISFKVPDGRKTGTIVEVHADNGHFIAQRSDGQGWQRPDLGTGRYWNIWPQHDKVELV